MNKFIYILSGFASGIAMGGYISYRIARKKFEERVDFEINAIKTLKKNYNLTEDNKQEDNCNATKEEKESRTTPAVKNYNEFYKAKTPTANKKVCNCEDSNTDDSRTLVSQLQIISDDEYESDFDCDDIILKLTSDGTLLDLNDSPVSANETIGDEFLSNFIQSTLSTLYIRNSEQKIIYCVRKI